MEKIMRAEHRRRARAPAGEKAAVENGGPAHGGAIRHWSPLSGKEALGHSCGAREICDPDRA
jgi:hypothetical protein